MITRRFTNLFKGSSIVEAKKEKLSCSSLRGYLNHLTPWLQFMQRGQHYCKTTLHCQYLFRAMCTAAFSAAQPGPPLVVSPCCHPIQFATLRMFVLKMHNFTVCTDILLIWMAAVRAIPQTLVALGVLSCTAPHSHAASKVWNISQSLSLEKKKKKLLKLETCSNISLCFFRLFHTDSSTQEFAALSLSSSSSSWPLASYQPLMACGCKCEVWRFVKSQG